MAISNNNSTFPSSLKDKLIAASRLSAQEKREKLMAVVDKAYDHAENLFFSHARTFASYSCTINYNKFSEEISDFNEEAWKLLIERMKKEGLDVQEMNTNGKVVTVSW